uniref:Integrase catalytic domain-containing protein n=1 Tax=Haemonchus contortus TaxID=6289 RepID=A0A7I4Z1T3_HAECO
MAGPTSLKSAKALLTRYCNTLERIIKENEGIVNADPEIFSDSANSTKAQAVTLQLNSSANLVTEALSNFTMMCDSMNDALSGDQEQQVEEYVTRAHSVLELAQTTAIQLESNVHNQPLTKLQKFNYLLKALQGEAREAVRRYPVVEENYDHAIELLRKKCGDEAKFIACLQARLESARAENPTLPSQRRLLENIIPIVTQLTEKGVPLDGSFLVQKILTKFSVDPEESTQTERCQTARSAAVQPPRDKRAHAATQPTSPTAQQSFRTNQRCASSPSHLAFRTATCSIYNRILAHWTTNESTKEEQGDRTDGVEATLVNSFTNFDEELERWDKYWTMDSAGVCKFTGTKNAEKDATNAKVAKFFEETIEKREDGYYIRFPYKENHLPLPTYEAIALKRLKTVLETLRRTPELLHSYDKTFRAQQEIGIIETVENPSLTVGAIVHYIPHQPVITPQKETTKLRIVFDASAHFKDSPSLNDVLHQGPLILPELYAMLLRFRIPKYVIISDVEEAFLQVRLHETDRDATRFLWVCDINEPFGIHNVATFRFTRVTFGLNVSPYLLGATINHHLRSAVKNEELAKEIRENLYVDNLILSAATPSEVARKSLEARKIFEEMGMNLREFLSNDETLRQQLPENACAK